MWQHCYKSMRRYFLLLLATVVLFSGCHVSKDNKPISGSHILLNTHVAITVYEASQEHLIEECFDLIRQYEKKLSRTIASSEIAMLNARETETVSTDTAALLKKALYFSELSNGAFDVTVGSVSSLWDFNAVKPTVPGEHAIREALTHVGYTGMTVDGTTVRFEDSQTTLDLGAIAKGYIADQVKAFLVENGVEHAIIDLGGNLLCIGDKPDGHAYTVGVQDPDRSRGELLLTVAIKDKSVVTSGIYERCFEVNGKTYHHILDPSTGYPVNHDLASVTIISDLSVDGDAYSTACMAMGLEKSQQLINSIDGIDAIWITKDGMIHYSNGLTDRYTISQ